MRALSRFISQSPLFKGARRLLEKNLANWNYPMNKWQKLWVGSYMILRDYGEGLFPYKQLDEEQAFAAEAAYQETLITLGRTSEQVNVGAMRKPFRLGRGCAGYLQDFTLIQSALADCGITPPSRLLEVGCGGGWMAEFLVTTGFEVVATTLEPDAEALVERRRDSIEAKGLPATLSFRISAMEYIHETVQDLPAFDAIYVYEALHHAHDWEKAIASFHQCLRPGGWCFIFKEPNVTHTFVSYRVGKLSNTHEIGMNRAAITKQARKVGFTRVDVLKHRMHWWTRPIWIAAQKSASA